MPASSRSVHRQQILRATAELLVEIVAEGGPRLGFGHAGRCLALWEELNGRAVFRAHDPTLTHFLRARGAPVGRGDNAPVVVLDRASTVLAEEIHSLHAEGRRVVLLDDLGPARMVADVVIDPPTAAAWPPAAGVRLAGFEHVLLRREVREAAKITPALRGGVLLAMGGSDPAGLTPVLAKALADTNTDVTIALGPGYRGSSPTTRAVLVGSAGFIPALTHAELLIAGYGHSLLEAAHLGVPAIAVVYRPEHLPHARAFCSQGVARMLDMVGGPRPAELAGLVQELLDAPHSRTAMAERGRELIDGLGAARIVKTFGRLGRSRRGGRPRERPAVAR